MTMVVMKSVSMKANSKNTNHLTEDLLPTTLRTDTLLRSTNITLLLTITNPMVVDMTSNNARRKLLALKLPTRKNLTLLRSWRRNSLTATNKLPTWKQNFIILEVTINQITKRWITSNKNYHTPARMITKIVKLLFTCARKWKALNMKFTSSRKKIIT